MIIFFSYFQSQDGVSHTHRSSSHRHRSPTTSSHKTEMDDSTISHRADNLDDTGLLEGDTSDICYHTSLISNGSSEHVKPEDEADSVNARTTAVLDHLSNKISRVRDLIKTEQKLRDGKFST